MWRRAEASLRGHNRSLRERARLGAPHERLQAVAARVSQRSSVEQSVSAVGGRANSQAPVYSTPACSSQSERRRWCLECCHHARLSHRSRDQVP